MVAGYIEAVDGGGAYEVEGTAAAVAFRLLFCIVSTNMCACVKLTLGRKQRRLHERNAVRGD
jgi:hypothetical protein